jgi:hypothetical protein
MDTNATEQGRASSRRRWSGAAALIGAGLIAGGILAGTQLAGAASSASSSTGSTTAASRTAPDPATMGHGPGETLLTGGAASKVTAAARAAVPGATTIRVETDSNGGGVYEAHMKKADGTYVTVLFDKSFKVTGTIDGFGPGGSPNGSSSGSSA